VKPHFVDEVVIDEMRTPEGEPKCSPNPRTDLEGHARYGSCGPASIIDWGCATFSLQSLYPESGVRMGVGRFPVKRRPP